MIRFIKIYIGKIFLINFLFFSLTNNFKLIIKIAYDKARLYDKNLYIESNAINNLLFYKIINTYFEISSLVLVLIIWLDTHMGKIQKFFVK